MLGLLPLQVEYAIADFDTVMDDEPEYVDTLLARFPLGNKDTVLGRVANYDHGELVSATFGLLHACFFFAFFYIKGTIVPILSVC